MLSTEKIYNVVYEYLKNEIEDIDETLKNWNILPVGKTGSGSMALINLCATLQDDIRTKANKTAGKGNIEKAMKAVIKSAEKINRPALAGFFISDGRPCVCDGFRIIRPYDMLEIGKPVEGVDIEKFLVPAKAGATAELELPTLGDIKAYIKITKAEGKADKRGNIVFDFGKNKPACNAVYLLDMLTAYPTAKAYYAPDRIFDPIYFIDEKGEGMLMPLHKSK